MGTEDEYEPTPTSPLHALEQRSLPRVASVADSTLPETWWSGQAQLYVDRMAKVVFGWKQAVVARSGGRDDHLWLDGTAVAAQRPWQPWIKAGHAQQLLRALVRRGARIEFGQGHDERAAVVLMLRELALERVDQPTWSGDITFERTIERALTLAALRGLLLGRELEPETVPTQHGKPAQPAERRLPGLEPKGFGRK